MESLECNPFKKISKEWRLVTAGDEKKRNTRTASWGGVGIMWGKNIATAYIRPQRYTKKFMDETGMYTLSFLSEDYRKALSVCGSVSGKDVEDKWGIDLSAISNKGKTVKRFDFVVKTKGYIYAIETNFYSSKG